MWEHLATQRLVGLRYSYVAGTVRACLQDRTIKRWKEVYLSRHSERYHCSPKHLEKYKENGQWEHQRLETGISCSFAGAIMSIHIYHKLKCHPPFPQLNTHTPPSRPSWILFLRRTGLLSVLIQTPAIALSKISFSSSSPRPGNKKKESNGLGALGDLY